VGVRESVEPHHFVVGAPDPRAAAAWRVKVDTIRDNYVRRLFPQKAHKAHFFDAFLEFILRPDTMTWSVLHLVQGTKPERRQNHPAPRALPEIARARSTADSAVNGPRTCSPSS
jgi:hypothetical protein